MPDIPSEQWHWLLQAATRVRWQLVAFTIVLTVGAALAVLGTAFWGWKFGMQHADVPTRVNTVVAVCAFILVAATLYVALFAYLAATGRPELQAELKFRFSEVNKPVLQAATSPTDGNNPAWREVLGFSQTLCEVTLVNNSRFSARNPGIRIELVMLAAFSEQLGWTKVAHTHQVGLTQIQWDGGADYLIHGRWSRVLPPLNFQGVHEMGRGTSALVVTIAADGVKPTHQRIPFALLDPEEFKAHKQQGAERAARKPQVRASRSR
jgi:hypothetical protein